MDVNFRIRLMYQSLLQLQACLQQQYHVIFLHFLHLNKRLLSAPINTMEHR